MIILETPGTGSALQEFEPQRVDYSAPEAGGRLGGVQAGFPLWLAVWTLGTIGARRSDLWRAWSARMRGQLRRFYARDLARPFPLAHIAGFAGMVRAGGGAFNGAATTWSQAIDADGNALLTLTGLPAGLILSIGDYCDFRWVATSADVAGTEWRDLVRVAASSAGTVGANGLAGTASGGGSVTVMVEPPISPVVPNTAVAHLDQPACIMTLVTDKTKLNGIDRRLALKSGSTIVGVQDLRP